MIRYDHAYRKKEYYWGELPSKYAIKVLEIIPPDRTLKLIDIGCGEGRNAVFFARNGYQVTAFDGSSVGVEKTKALARAANVELEVFQADILQFQLKEKYDIIYASGVLHYIPDDLRDTIFSNYKECTNENGIHVCNVFVKKPFIPTAPDTEETAQLWVSGQLFTYYHDWKVEDCKEEIFDCMSSGVPHKHAINRIIARKTATI